MSKAQLSAAETAEMFRHVADHIEANVDRLTQADQAIGDGDHGVGMSARVCPPARWRYGLSAWCSRSSDGRLSAS